MESNGHQSESRIAKEPTLPLKVAFPKDRSPSTGERLDRIPKEKIARLLEVYQLYREKGTLRKVATHLGVSHNRVRALLFQGANLGLFKYSPRDFSGITREKIVADFMALGSLKQVAKTNKISAATLSNILQKERISTSEIRQFRIERLRKKCIEDFKSYSESLGHFPTSTELQCTKKGKVIYETIFQCWRSINNFRRELKIPIPPRRKSRQKYKLLHPTL